jgi:hypothetical protein
LESESINKPLTEQDFLNDTPKKWYDGFEAGVHTVYVGEVIGAWKK